VLNRFLKEIKLELTQECPLACVHCSTNSSRKQTNSLSKSVAIRLLHEAADLGVEKVVFTGGEPLVWPYLTEAIRTAASLHISTTLYTTGILDNALTPLSRTAASDFVQLGLRRFIFSLYSDRANIHDSITRYGTHSATIIALQNATASGCPVELHFVAMKRNFRDLPGVVRLASETGLERVSVLRFVPQGRGRGIAEREDLDSADLRALASSITQLRLQYPEIRIRAGSPFNILDIGHSPCNAAQDVLVINHRGDIFPCDAFKNVRYAEPLYGSVLSNPLKEVWQKSQFLQKVRDILSEEKLEPCAGCAISGGCQSGCLAQKVIRKGWTASREPDPSCLVEPREDIEPCESGLVQISLG
jgi:radical SAM protein with 4Fe4S-binding SPASM domain